MILLRDIDHVRYYVGQFVKLCEEGRKRVSYFVDIHLLQIRMFELLLKGVQESSEEVYANNKRTKQHLEELAGSFVQQRDIIVRVCSASWGAFWGQSTLLVSIYATFRLTTTLVKLIMIFKGIVNSQITYIIEKIMQRRTYSQKEILVFSNCEDLQVI